MVAYKFLSAGAVGLFSGFRWPVPSADDQGVWVSVDGPLEPYSNGIHACRVRHLPYWINDELWTAELADEMTEEERVLVARRARLVRLVADWSADTARELAEACAWRSRGHAAQFLERRGLARQAAELAGCRRLDSFEAAATAVADATSDEEASRVAGYAADVASYAASAARPGAPETPAAWACCAAYVTALAARDLAGDEAVAAERGWQATWLADRLGLTGEDLY